MKTFSLKVLASDKDFFDGRCQMVVLPAKDGQLGVLANHGDMVTALSMGEMRIQKEDGTWETVLIGKGIMQDVNNRMLVLVEFAEHPEEIDQKRALEAKQRAEEQLRQKQSILEYHHSKAALARALARIRESSK